MIFNNFLRVFALESLILLIFTSYFFLWSQSFIIFDERLLIISLLPLYFFLNKRPINKSLIFLFSGIFFFILVHKLITNFYFKFPLFYNFQSLIGFLLITVVAIFYRSYLINNLNKIIYFFFSILILCFILENIIYDNQYSLNNFDCLNGWFSTNSKLFSENSHFGMIAPAIISYLIFMKNNKTKYKYLNIIFIIFLFLFISTTMLVGISISLGAFLLFKYKLLNSFQKILSILVLIISIVLLLLKPQCNMRLTETIEGLYVDLKSKYYNDPSIKMAQTLNKFGNGSLNQSTEVFLGSYDISYKSLKSHPLGVGLNNYKISFEKFRSEEFYTIWNVNKEDGSNNFSKIIAEFGIFGLLFFSILLYIFFKDNKNLNTNVFFYSIIITQLLRGAGYFNGSFLLCVFIVLSFILLKEDDVKYS